MTVVCGPAFLQVGLSSEVLAPSIERSNAHPMTIDTRNIILLNLGLLLLPAAVILYFRLDRAFPVFSLPCPKHWEYSC